MAVEEQNQQCKPLQHEVNTNNNVFDFIAIDFETANSDLSSACSIGIACVLDCEVVKTFSSYIKPLAGHFDNVNIGIHGITPDAVHNSPSLNDLLPEIEAFFSVHTPIVAHNANFDMSVLKQSASTSSLEFFYVDTMDISSLLLGGRYGLKKCADMLSIELGNHHDAACDALVCASFVIRALQHANCSSLWEYIAKERDINLRRFSELAPTEKFHENKKKHRRFNSVRPCDLCVTTSNIDTSGSLYNANIVFTGELSIDRPTAMQIALNAGAVIKTSVSKKTNFLVVGKQDKSLVGEDGISTKEENAYKLNASGTANIRIIDEAEFICLAGKAVHL